MSEYLAITPPELEASLRHKFSQGPLIEGNKRLLEEHTVARPNGLKIEIFSKEHPPPHFRVTYGGETNNFRIDTCEPMNGISLKKWFKTIKEWHSENRAALISTWNSTRPTGCPVGKIPVT